jgi:secondary thiamine-phosphate synthase enzyme
MSQAHPLKHYSQHTFAVHSRGRGLVDITENLRNALAASDAHGGIVNVFVHHTSCSLIISENADPTVQADLERFFARLVPDGDPLFQHDAEGPDDMPAHVRAVLTATSITLPVHGGKLVLGTWQALYLWEHRIDPHQRKVTATFVGA